MAKINFSMVVVTCVLAGAATLFLRTETDDASSEKQAVYTSPVGDRENFSQTSKNSRTNPPSRADYGSDWPIELQFIPSEYVPLENIDFEKLGYSETLQLLTNILLNSVDYSEKLKVINLLAAIDEKESYDVLSLALGSSQPPDLRLQALNFIGTRGGDSIHYLGQVLMTQTDPELLSVAIELLGQDGSAAAIALLDMAQNNLGLPYSRQSHEWLSKLGQSMPASDSDDTASAGLSYETQFIVELNEQSREDGIATIHQFSLLDLQLELDALSVVLESDSKPYLKKEAINVLQEIGGSEVFDVAAIALGDEDPEIRHQVVKLFEEGGAEILPYLGQVIFGDPDIDLRILANEIVSGVDSPAAQALLEAEIF